MAEPFREPRRRRQVQAAVALALLEGVRDHDRPGELLDDENVAVTMPRRFGLSGVVDAQIRRYEREARRGHRIPEPEFRDLIRLVSRRPDAEGVLRDVGRSLTAAAKPRWRRILPDRLALDLARKRIRRRFKTLFGSHFLLTPRGSRDLEAADDLLFEEDPRGTACALVTGLAQAVLEAYGSVPRRVVHTSCRARGDDRCRWGISDSSAEERGEDTDPSLTGEGNGAPTS